MHIPLLAREAVGWERPGVATISVQKGSLTVKPRKSEIMSLAGSLHTAHLKNPLNIDNARDQIDYSGELLS
jgi:hypothetical protein